MLIAKRKSTGEILRDFQSGATEIGLLANAARLGIDAADVEILDVRQEEFDKLVQEAFAAERLVYETEAKKREENAQKAREKLLGLGLANEEIDALLLSMPYSGA